jgi:hypothetical protein
VKCGRAGVKCEEAVVVDLDASSDRDGAVTVPAGGVGAAGAVKTEAAMTGAAPVATRHATRKRAACAELEVPAVLATSAREIINLDTESDGVAGTDNVKRPARKIARRFQ